MKFNFFQVVIALTGGEIVYFEMDPVSKLNYYYYFPSNKL